MKRTILICLFLLLIPLTVQAQKTLQDAAQATGNGSDLVITVGAQQTNGVTAQVSGTFSGTITWRATVDGTNFIDVQGTNLTTGVTATTATAAGLYSFLLPRVSTFRAPITTYGSGSITVVAAAAVGVARVYSEGGGGGVSQVTGVDTNGFTFSIANPTTTPAITITMQNAAADGSTKGVAGFTAADFDALSGIISLDYTNAQKATSSVPGFLSAADWSTFNSKQAALGFTAENVANKDTDGTLAANSDTKYASQKATKTYADTKEVPLTFSSPLVRATNTVACATCGVTGSGLNQFASTTSAQFLGVISNETGSGLVMGNDTPTIITPSFTTGFTIGGAATSRKIIVGNGTNFVASTETYAVPGTSGNVMTSDGTNWTSAAPAGGGNPFDDGTAIIKGSGDATKLLRIEVDGFTAGTTRVITPPDSNTSLPVYGATITYTGPTAARTVTYPDANFTVARTDAGQTFTGTQAFGAITATGITQTGGAGISAAGGVLVNTTSSKISIGYVALNTIGLGSNGVIGFTASAGDGTPALNTGLSEISAGLVGIGTGAQGSFAGSLKLATANTVTADAGTTTVINGLITGHNSSGTPTAGFGSGIKYQGQSSTTADQDMAQMAALWTTATHASRSADITFSVVNNASALAEAARITSVGNFKVGGTASRGTTEGTNQVVIFNGTAPAGTLTNGASFYADAGEMKVIDSAGNSTLLSPHDLLTNEWIFLSCNSRLNNCIKVNMEKLVHVVEQLSGQKILQEWAQ